MVPQHMPKSLIIVGSGAIGAEFASFYNDMGVEVTMIESVDRILPVEDPDVSAFVAEASATNADTSGSSTGKIRSTDSIIVTSTPISL